MAKLHSSRAKHRMAALGLDSKSLAFRAKIHWGSLRNELAGRDTVSLTRAYQIARVLTRPGERLEDVVADILAASDDPAVA